MYIKSEIQSEVLIVSFNYTLSIENSKKSIEMMPGWACFNQNIGNIAQSKKDPEQ